VSIIEATILGLVQGLTEFIPVSSSGHLVLLHKVMDIDGGLLFDVALHIGTLLALMVYFWRDLVQLTLGILGRNEHSTTARLIALATIPAVITGVMLQDIVEHRFRSIVLVSINLILVALLMLWAESRAQKMKKLTPLRNISLKQALIMGIAQATAVIPGVSRSGSTITAGLFAGIDRVAATRFSFLLAIPITFGAILKVVATGDAIMTLNGEKTVFFVGIASAFLSGLFAIRFLLQYLSKHSLRIFAYYRIGLGILMLSLTLLN
jgi:undecaprenyl-diphosphatase